MSRTKKKQIYIYLTEEELERLNGLCDLLNQPRGEYLRTAMVEKMAQTEFWLHLRESRQLQEETPE